MGLPALIGGVLHLMVRFAASVLALVIRVGMKVSIWGHQASIVLRSRVVSGIAATRHSGRR